MDKRLVRVTWIDASDPDGQPGWMSDDEVEEFSKETVEVTSIGWIKSNTKQYLTLVADYIPGESPTWGRATKVPHGMITKIEDLVVKDS